MGVEAIIAAVIGLSGAVGGFAEGRRRQAMNNMSIASETVDMLEAQVGLLTAGRLEKDEVIADLQTRVEVLEGLVTQRAEVAAVHEEVLEVRDVVDRIASKVGA